MNTRSKAGFTLVEMSFVLIIIGLVIMIVFPALKTITQSTQNSTTQTNLKALMHASAAFTQANGCVPCPTPASATKEAIGYVRGDTSGIACAACANPEGIVPFASLGVPEHMAKDGWGNWITMGVDPALAINFGSAPPASVCLSSDPAPCVRGESRKGLCQEALTSTNRLSIRSQNGSLTEAAILFASHGLNGTGAYRKHKTGFTRHGSFAFTCSANRGFENCNADGNQSFSVAPYTTGEYVTFDDQLLYLGRNALVSYLGNAACQTEW